MNTQSHVVINLFILRKLFRQDTNEIPRVNITIFFGSILPDLPIILFFIYYTWIAPRPQNIIWEQLYYDPGWQVVFNTVNSIPIFALLALIFYVLKKPGCLIFCLASLLHFLQDFFLHYDDGHAHLFPLSDYIFRSPVSYWDPDKYGFIASFAETAVVLALSIFLYRVLRKRVWKIGIILANVLNIFNYPMWYFIISFF